jgi:hypothetical protein
VDRPGLGLCPMAGFGISSIEPSGSAVRELVNPVKTGFLLNNICKSSPYRTGNTLCLRYKAQLVNAVWGNSRCLL